MKDILLRATGVRKTIGATRALLDASLEVRRGDIVGMIGANGAGKTTLIRIVIGLLAPDAGRVEGSCRPAVGAPVGYLPEERGLYQRQKVGATLTYLARLKGFEARSAALESSRCLERVGMTASAGRRLGHLSKGQQQKIQLAAALLGDPDLLVLDEPFSGLDPLNARLVCDLARATAERGRGVLLSAHQLALIEQICTHVVMLSRGRVVVAGRIDDVRAHCGPLDDMFTEAGEDEPGSALEGRAS